MLRILPPRDLRFLVHEDEIADSWRCQVPPGAAERWVSECRLRFIEKGLKKGTNLDVEHVYCTGGHVYVQWRCSRRCHGEKCNRWSEVSAGFEAVRIVGNPRGGLNFEHDSRDNDTWSLTVVGSVLKGSRDQGRSVA
jgi:hypothetical protein